MVICRGPRWEHTARWMAKHLVGPTEGTRDSQCIAACRPGFRRQVPPPTAPPPACSLRVVPDDEKQRERYSRSRLLSASTA